MPLLFKYQEPLWGVWKTDENSEDLLSMLDKKESYKTSLSDMRTENRKKEWLAVRVLVKELLGEEVSIAYRSNGAPCFIEKKFHISISHTKGYVAVFISPSSPVGIDIEYISDRVQKIRTRFLSEEENRHIDLVNEKEHLLIHWCAKETLFKAIGKENVDFIDHLHITPFLYEKEGCLTAFETRTSDMISYKVSYRVYDDFIVTFSNVRQT